MTEAQARQHLQQARRKAARFRHLRNFWRVQVRRRLHRLQEIEASRPHLDGNVVLGGDLVQRLAYLFEVAPPIFRLYYDEDEPFASFPWAVHNVPADKWRSDCSSWGRDVAQCVGAVSGAASLALRAGGGFWTGWVTTNCRQVDRTYAERHPGTIVLFGTGPGFHMGLSKAEGELLIQHGTAALSVGTFDQFGEGTEVRFYQFLT